MRVKSQRKRKRTGADRRVRRKKIKADKSKEDGEWQTVVGPNGKQILQRVLALPSQTIDLSKGYHAVG